MCLAGNGGGVRNYGWLFEPLFASLVGALELFLWTVREKTQGYASNLQTSVKINLSQDLINLIDWQ